MPENALLMSLNTYGVKPPSNISFATNDDGDDDDD